MSKNTLHTPSDSITANEFFLYMKYQFQWNYELKPFNSLFCGKAGLMSVDVDTCGGRKKERLHSSQY